MSPEITSDQVLELLATRHSTDVFVSECKDGPTHFVRNYSRLDAWVMPRSWAHPACTGYEIKVSRSDFLGDEKWTDYLPLCNLFYFVAPAGVIEKGEIPEPCGLLQVSKNAKRLTTVKRAPFREVRIPEDLWRYILMCRTQITPPHMDGTQSPADYWRGWLRAKTEDRELGQLVSSEIRRTFRERVTAVERTQARQDEEMQPLREAKQLLDEMGITVGLWYSHEELKKKILDAFRASIPLNLKWDLDHLEKDLQRFRKRVTEFEAEQEKRELGRKINSAILLQLEREG